MSASTLASASSYPWSRSLTATAGVRPMAPTIRRRQCCSAAIALRASVMLIKGESDRVPPHYLLHGHPLQGGRAMDGRLATSLGE